jgi:hypothetical protein
MIIPDAENIETALALLNTLPKNVEEDQLKEFHEAVGNTSMNVDNAFLLGLQTARVMVASSTKLLMSGVNPEEVL